MRIGDAEPLSLRAEYVLNVRIEAVDEDQATRTQRVLFGPGEVRLGGRRLRWTFEGQAYRLQRDQYGRPVQVLTAAAAPASGTGDFAATFHDLALGTYFAEQGVAEGAEWLYRLADEPPVFEPAALELEDRSVRAYYTGKLSSLRVVAGTPIARIASVLKSDATSRAGTVHTESAMEVEVDCPDGWLLRGEGKFSVTITPIEGAVLSFEDMGFAIAPHVPSGVQAGNGPGSPG